MTAKDVGNLRSVREKKKTKHKNVNLVSAVEIYKL